MITAGIRVDDFGVVSAWRATVPGSLRRVGFALGQVALGSSVTDGRGRSIGCSPDAAGACSRGQAAGCGTWWWRHVGRLAGRRVPIRSSSVDGVRVSALLTPSDTTNEAPRLLEGLVLRLALIYL